MFGRGFKKMNNTENVFFELLKAGLWGEADANLNVNHNLFEGVEWEKIYQLAQEQSVLGLVLAGLEQYKNLNADLDLNIPKVLLLQWIGEVQVIEKQNKDMNVFIADLIEKLRKYDIYTLLIKGQGIAQCYDKPLWRVSGDIDLLSSKDNYDKAKSFLLPKGVMTEPEEAAKRHLAMQIEQWAVELHGTLHVGLSARVDRMLDNVQEEIFYGEKVRSWMNGNTQVFLPAANEDVVYVFAHILQHFYKGGIGLRQIYDWCRLLYTYKDSLDKELLEVRIKRAGLMTEWKAFGAFAVGNLGMPLDAMPFYSADQRWKKKAAKICSFVLEVGNFGHNRDNSYFQKHSYFVQKCISAWRRVKDLCRHARIFPLNSFRFFFGIMFNGVRSAIRGE